MTRVQFHFESVERSFQFLLSTHIDTGVCAFISSWLIIFTFIDSQIVKLFWKNQTFDFFANIVRSSPFFSIKYLAELEIERYFRTNWKLPDMPNCNFKKPRKSCIIAFIYELILEIELLLYQAYQDDVRKVRLVVFIGYYGGTLFLRKQCQFGDKIYCQW